MHENSYSKTIVGREVGEESDSGGKYLMFVSLETNKKNPVGHVL